LQEEARPSTTKKPLLSQFGLKRWTEGELLSSLALNIHDPCLVQCIGVLQARSNLVSHLAVVVSLLPAPVTRRLAQGKPFYFLLHSYKGLLFVIRARNGVGDNGEILRLAVDTIALS
jgi:hypothetical protein